MNYGYVIPNLGRGKGLIWVVESGLVNKSILLFHDLSLSELKLVHPVVIMLFSFFLAPIVECFLQSFLDLMNRIWAKRGSRDFHEQIDGAVFPAVSFHLSLFLMSARLFSNSQISFRKASAHSSRVSRYHLESKGFRSEPPGTHHSMRAWYFKLSLS